MAWEPGKNWWEYMIPGWSGMAGTHQLFKGIGNLFKGISGKTSAEATAKANETNIANQNYWNEVQMQREDTAHQREVADLQAAGLNPWLSVSGQGAQTSALSTAQVEPVDGSKILATTSAATLLALVKLITKL